MKSKISEYMYKRYLNGECTADEEIKIRDWYNSFENSFNYIDGLTYPEKELLRHKIFARVLKNTTIGSKYNFQSDEVTDATNGLKMVAYIMVIIITAIIALGVIILTRNPH